MDESSGRKKQIIAALAVLIVIVVIVGGVVAFGGKDESSEHAHHHASSSSNSSTSTVAADPNATYKDGTYKATGDYVSPGGNQEITVSVTVKDGVITDTSAQNGASDTESKEHQEDFIDNYKSQVVGKKLSEVSLSRVSGSSLTSQGFNDAIQQIRDQAEV
jgi:uncharacterized protein with FMN-binding domain